MFELNSDVVTRVLSVVDAGLVVGLGKPKPGEMCVEAAVCYALGLPHGDDPSCVHPAIRSLKITLNDSSWSSDTVRAAGMRRLAILQLGTKDFDGIEFAKRVALMTVKTILPTTLVACGLTNQVAICKNAQTLTEAAEAAYAAEVAAYAARSAADAVDAAVEAAVEAARSVTYAAEAAEAAARDKVLRTFATNVENILIDMKVPATAFLSMI